MRIQTINSYNNNFTSCWRQVWEQKDEHTTMFKHSNQTHFFRKDLKWNQLQKFLLEKYKDTEKVNTYCYACSDGSEPYSLVMKFLSNENHSANKFLPIIAKDYDEEIIKIAKSNEVFIPTFELLDINSHVDKQIEKFFKYAVKEANGKPGLTYKVTNNLSDNVIFEVADICKDIKNIKPDNSVVFCRNFWPYLKNNTEMYMLARNLYNQLGKNSIVVLGHFDEGYKYPYRAMFDAGFVLVDEDLRIFEKSSVRKIY